jgi:hypothetical protein
VYGLEQLHLEVPETLCIHVPPLKQVISHPIVMAQFEPEGHIKI